MIDNCPYEENRYIDKESGEIKHASIKCIAKSHPLYQEFRLWQFIVNLRIYRKETDVDVTQELLPTEADYVTLFEWLNEKKEIDQKAFLNTRHSALRKQLQTIVGIMWKINLIPVMKPMHK